MVKKTTVYPYHGNDNSFKNISIFLLRYYKTKK